MTKFLRLLAGGCLGVVLAILISMLVAESFIREWMQQYPPPPLTLEETIVFARVDFVLWHTFTGIMLGGFLGAVGAPFDKVIIPTLIGGVLGVGAGLVGGVFDSGNGQASAAAGAMFRFGFLFYAFIGLTTTLVPHLIVRGVGWIIEQ
jgi:hypothetical protein